MFFVTIFDKDLINETNHHMFAHENQKKSLCVFIKQTLFFHAFQCLLSLLSLSRFMSCSPPWSNLNFTRSCTSIEVMIERWSLSLFLVLSSFMSDLQIISFCIILINYYVCICNEAPYWINRILLSMVVYWKMTIKL